MMHIDVNIMSQNYKVQYKAKNKTVEGNTEEKAKEVSDVPAKNNSEVIYSSEETTPKKPITYKSDMVKVAQMKEILDKNMLKMIKAMVKESFGKQIGIGQLLKKVLNGEVNLEAFESNFGELSEEIVSELSEDKIKEAQASIAEDGYWGVEQTSDRIVEFAHSISGGDPKKLELLKNAIIDGFNEAAKLWGEDLPEISQQTFDKTLEKIEEVFN